MRMGYWSVAAATERTGGNDVTGRVAASAGVVAAGATGMGAEVGAVGAIGPARGASGSGGEVRSVVC